MVLIGAYVGRYLGTITTSNIRPLGSRCKL